MAQARKQAKPQAKPQVAADEPAIIIGGDDPDLKVDSFADEDATLLKIFNELDQDEGASWIVTVHAVPAVGGKAEYLFQCDPSQLEGLRDRLRDEAGTGTYIARVKRNGQVRGIIWFRIRALGGPVRGPAAAPPPVNGQLEQILLAMKQQNDAIMALAMRGPAAAPAASTSLKELVETMISLKSLTAEGQGSTQVNLIMEGIRLAKELQGSDREPGMFETLLGSPVLQKLMESFPIPQPASAVVPAVTDQSGARPLRAVAPPPAPAVADPFVTQLHFLVERAKNDDDPRLYAFMVRDVLAGSPVLAQLRAAGQRALPFLIEACPAISGHESWFAEMLDSLSQIMAEDERLPGADEVSGAGAATTAEGSQV